MVHVSWCSVQYLVTDEVIAVTLSRCYVLPLHIIQVYPAVCVSCVLWHYLNRPSALSDMLCCTHLSSNTCPGHSDLICPWQMSAIVLFLFLGHKLYWCWGLPRMAQTWWSMEYIRFNVSAAKCMSERAEGILRWDAQNTWEMAGWTSGVGGGRK